MKSFYLKPGERCTDCGRRFAANAIDQHKKLQADKAGEVTKRCLDVDELPTAGLTLTKRGIWVLDSRQGVENFQPEIVL